MSRIYKGSETTLKLLVHSCDEGVFEDVKVYLYTHDPENAIEFTNDRITIEGDIVSLKTDKWTFNNQNEGVINYIAKCKVNGNVFVTERQSSYYLKATEDFNPTDAFKLLELNETLTANTFSINASERECAGFSAVTIDATQYAEDKYQEGYEDGRPVLGELNYQVSADSKTFIASSANLDGYSRVYVNAGPYATDKYNSGYTKGYEQANFDVIYNKIKKGDGTYQFPYSALEAYINIKPEKNSISEDDFYIIGRVATDGIRFGSEDITDEYNQFFKGATECKYSIQSGNRDEYPDYLSFEPMYISNEFHEFSGYENKIVKFSTFVFATSYNGYRVLVPNTNTIQEITELDYIGYINTEIDENVTRITTKDTFYNGYDDIRIDATQFGITKYESGYTSGYESGYTSGYTVGYEEGESGEKTPKIPNGLTFKGSTMETFDMSPYDWTDHYFSQNLFEDCKNLQRLENVPENWKPYGTTAYMFYNCTLLNEAPMMDMSCVGNTEHMFDNCSSLTTIPQYNMHYVGNANGMFRECRTLQSIPQLDFTNMRSCVNIVNGVKTDCALGGFTNIRCHLNINFLRDINHSSLMNVINGLYDFTGNGIAPDDTEGNLTINPLSENKISDEEKAIATSKGWIITM